MDDPRWVEQRDKTWLYLPPFASCPHCGDVWIAPGVIGPLSGEMGCSCEQGARYTQWECWRCHSIVAERCLDVTKWREVPVDCRWRFGQADIDARL